MKKKDILLTGLVIALGSAIALAGVLTQDMIGVFTGYLLMLISFANMLGKALKREMQEVERETRMRRFDEMELHAYRDSGFSPWEVERNKDELLKARAKLQALEKSLENGELMKAQDYGKAL